MAELALEDLGSWQGIGGRIRRAQAEAALRASGEWVRQTWISAVSGALLPGMSAPVRDRAYARAIARADLYTIAQEGRRLVLRFKTPAEVYPQYTRWENGRPAYDLKPGLLAGKSAHDGKKGRYTVVPLRHRAPGGGRKGGETGGGYASVLPWSVYRALRKVEAGGGTRLEGDPWEPRGGPPLLDTFPGNGAAFADQPNPRFRAGFGQRSKPSSLIGPGAEYLDSMTGQVLNRVVASQNPMRAIRIRMWNRMYDTLTSGSSWDRGAVSHLYGVDSIRNFAFPGTQARTLDDYPWNDPGQIPESSGRYYTGYTWKTGAYAGLQRSRFGKGLVTFRTVSERSDPNSWLVPARRANPVTSAVARYAQQQLGSRLRGQL